MSILRAYLLFRTMGCRHMVVLDIANSVIGMLSRHDLADLFDSHTPNAHEAIAPRARKLSAHAIPHFDG
eukprot:SAG31_NODE_29918_length_388_cov_0.719723_1_plen_69_part_00